MAMLGLNAKEMDAGSAHVYRAPDGADGHVVFDLRSSSGSYVGHLAIHGTHDERLAVLEAWARAEGLELSRSITDDYGVAVLVPV